MMRKSLDYKFSNGNLVVTRQDFNVPDVEDKSIIDGVSAEETKELWANAIRGVWYEDYERDEQGNYILDENGDRIGKGSSVEYAILKPDAEGSLGVQFMGLAGDFNPISEREAATTLKSRETSLGPLLIINNPGSGQSSPLPLSVIKKMKKEGSFIPQGEHYADIIGPQIQELASGRGIEVLGHSLGANTAIGFTAAYFAAMGEQVDGLRLVAPLGTKRHVWLDTILRFAVAEGLFGASRYSKRSPYNELNELGVKEAVARTTNSDWIRSMIKNLATLKQNVWDLPVVVGRKSLKGDLERALSAISSELTVVSLEQSKFGDPKATKQILARLALMPDRPDSITYHEVLDHSLAAISAGAGARVLASLYGLRQ